MPCGTPRYANPLVPECPLLAVGAGVRGAAEKAGVVDVVDVVVVAVALTLVLVVRVAVGDDVPFGGPCVLCAVTAGVRAAPDWCSTGAAGGAPRGPGVDR